MSMPTGLNRREEFNVLDHTIARGHWRHMNLWNAPLFGESVWVPVAHLLQLVAALSHPLILNRP